MKRGPTFNSLYHFTFVEIVVCIFVMGLLMFILAPTLKSTKESVYRSTCEFNLHAVSMALKSYADDYDVYPLNNPLIATLINTRYLSAGGDFYCPLDKSEDPDTYSSGYMGGHPRTTQNNEMLVVCGWHPRIGSLAVYGDYSVGTGTNGEEFPITITHNGEGVGPGFQLHDNDALAIASEDGNEVYIYGDDGAYFISATYDPNAHGGDGEFIVTIGFDTESGEEQGVSGESNGPYLTLVNSFEYSKIEMTNSPDDWNETKLSWKPDVDPGTNLVKIEYFSAYKLTHLSTGQLIENEYSGQATFEYDVNDANMSEH